MFGFEFQFELNIGIRNFIFILEGHKKRKKMKHVKSYLSRIGYIVVCPFCSLVEHMAEGWKKNCGQVYIHGKQTKT